MTAKEELKKKFSSDPDKYYKVRLFDEMDFIRRKCSLCGGFFWTLDASRTHCPNPPCESYGFIGTPLNKGLDYIKTWSAIEKFFVKNGHTSIPSYPVVCRWFPGLYFTVASIVAFQRAAGNKTVFELPANPLIIPQSCMRFNDIPNVGVTGRHFTNFTMIGQHSIYDEKKKEGYWKDRCIELDFRLLTEAFGIKPEEISFMEDVWVGPNAFGYSLEYYYKGLELGNAVFTEFAGTPENYRQMDQKVIDMGAGLNRFAWINKGSSTAYEAVFGPVAKDVLKLVEHDESLWTEYSKVSGKFNMEDFRNYRSAKEKAAKELNMSTDELIKMAAPVEAVFSIADHARSLLVAVADGGLPSNVGGGYNLRVILRRALGFIDEFGFDMRLYDVCKAHAKYLKPLNPRLKTGLGDLEDILRTEEERYRASRKKGEQLLHSMVSKKRSFTTESLIELYESHGVTPETIEKIAKKENIQVEIPTNFYDILSSRHMKEKAEDEAKLNLEGLPPTRLLFYEDQKLKEFAAKVQRVLDEKYVVLDQTAFYGKAGGQDGDTGTINGDSVVKTEKYGDIIVHVLESVSFREGDKVKGVVDMERREQIMKHHTAVHVLHGASHAILGNHVWQAGANKTYEKAHLDITHHKPLTDEETDRIEELANKIVDSETKIRKYVLPRIEAEKKHGFTLYQGGAIPHKDLRIVEIPAGKKIFDVEACSGTHCASTKEMKPIVVMSTERIQDGIVRINIVTAGAAQKYLEMQEEILKRSKDALGVKKDVLKAAEKLLAEWKELRKKSARKTESRAEHLASELEKKVVNNVLVAEIEGDARQLQAISKRLSSPDRVILLFGVVDKIYVFGSAGENTGRDIGKIVRKACEELGGKGGGIGSIGQGVGFRKDALEDVMKRAESELL